MTANLSEKFGAILACHRIKSRHRWQGFFRKSVRAELLEIALKGRDLLRLVFELEGKREYDRTFTRFTEQLRDLRQIWGGVTPLLRRITLEQFAYEGKGESGQWRELSPAYAKWKSRHYPGSPILQRTGALQLSLTSRTPFSVVISRKDSLTFGTKLNYGIYHQSRRPRKKLPRRPIFDFTEAHRNLITKAIQTRLIKAGRDNGVTVS